MSSSATSATVCGAGSTRSSTRPASTRSAPARWVVVRVVQEATRELGDPTSLTKYVALAKAVQD